LHSTKEEKMRPTEIVLKRLNAEGEPIIAGYMWGTLFRKVVDSRDHKLRILNAYGIQSEAIDQIAALGCESIDILEVDTGTTYRCSFHFWIEHAMEHDFGAGKQMFVTCEDLQAFPAELHSEQVQLTLNI